MVIDSASPKDKQAHREKERSRVTPVTMVGVRPNRRVFSDDLDGKRGLVTRATDGGRKHRPFIKMSETYGVWLKSNEGGVKSMGGQLIQEQWSFVGDCDY